jgi:hypothetical protein
MIFLLEHTLSLLFSAQRQSTMPSPPQQFIEPETQIASEPLHQERGQKSLHAFWHLPSRLTPSPSNSSAASPVSQQRRGPFCEDCDKPLFNDSDADEMDMEIDSNASSLFHNFGCRSCRRCVCGQCCVMSLNDGRTCLSCAKNGLSRKTWVGGIGWM